MIEPSSKNSIKRSIGYTRIKTESFTDKKQQLLAKKDRFKRPNHQLDKQKLISTDSSSTSIEIGSTGTLPPLWVDYYEESVQKLNSIDQIVKDAAKLINSRIKMQFGDHSDLDRQIDLKSQQATRILKECEERYRKIQEIGLMNEESAGDKRIRENVIRILATRIQEATMHVRKQQKGLFNQLKDHNEGGGKDYRSPASTEYSEEQRQEMEGMEDIARGRDEDINRLIDTINELSHLFKQMNQQVIEQGTLVDRIDYNVEQALGHVQTGKKELIKARNYQNSKCGDWCVKVLVIMNLIFSLLLILKFAHRG